MATITSTKNVRSLVSGATNTAGSTTTSSAWDLSTTPGDSVLEAIVTNGATGPTIACTVTVQVSSSGTDANYVDSAIKRTATTTNSAVSRFMISIPAGFKFVKVTFSGNTGQSVTCDARGHEFTNLVSA